MAIIHEILNYLGTKDNYLKLKEFIKPDAFPKEARDILKAMDRYFSTTSNDWVDWPSFGAWASVAMPTTSLDSDLLQAVADATVSDDVAQVFIDRLHASGLADTALRIAEGSGSSWDEVQTHLDTYRNSSKRLSKALRDAIHDEEDLETTLTKAAANTGLEWPLPSLNRLLGRLSTELVILAARPDGGKTTFLAQSAWYFARQLAEGRTVLWCNNEEAIDKVKRRVACSALEITDADLLADPVGNSKLYHTIVPKGRIVFIDNADHINVVQKAIDKYNPGVIIIDQLYKVAGTVGSDDVVEAERFRRLCNWARDIAKSIAPVIITNQLDVHAEGIMYPPQAALFGSKTGAQGEADIILTIGRIPTDPDHRYLHTPKNKVTSSDEQLCLPFNRFKARFYEI